jgi:dTDP-4-amino-4,6-dideoxygalactose transaminase
MNNPIALGQPTVGAEELAQVQRVFESGWLSGAGPTCKEFERRFAVTTGTQHTLATANCGAALHLAIEALGAGPGDEVVVADYTFPATGHSVVWNGAKPVFADVRPDIWTVDPSAVEAALTERTVGIVAVDVVGQPADYDELRGIADKHGLWLVEDAACSAGASYRGRPAGSLADVATFSFHGRKGITAGEGGALTTDRPEVDARARKMHTYGITPALARAGSTELPVPHFDDAGYNFRMSDVAAGIMLAQLDRLPTLVAARRRVADGYAAQLAEVEGLTLPVELPDRTNPWQSYILTLDRGINRGEVAQALRERGIGCNFGTYASHLQPVYAQAESCPVSADLFVRQLAIPMHANLTEDEVDQVCSAVREVLSSLSVRA